MTTAKPQRIQLSRRKGFNLQEVSRALNGLPAVNCARPSKFGNPYHVVKSPGTAWHVMFDGHYVGAHQYKVDAVRQAVIKHQNWLNGPDGGAIRALAKRMLHGKNGACWCEPESPCHCDHLLFVANPESRK